MAPLEIHSKPKEPDPENRSNIFDSKIFILISLCLYQHSLQAEVPYILDFKYILNESDAGKKAQKFLQSKLHNDPEIYQKIEWILLVEKELELQLRKLELFLNIKKN